MIKSVYSTAPNSWAPMYVCIYVANSFDTDRMPYEVNFSTANLNSEFFFS